MVLAVFLSVALMYRSVVMVTIGFVAVSFFAFPIQRRLTAHANRCTQVLRPPCGHSVCMCMWRELLPTCAFWGSAPCFYCLVFLSPTSAASLVRSAGSPTPPLLRPSAAAADLFSARLLWLVWSRHQRSLEAGMSPPPLEAVVLLEQEASSSLPLCKTKTRTRFCIYHSFYPTGRGPEHSVQWRASLFSYFVQTPTQLAQDGIE